MSGTVHGPRHDILSRSRPTILASPNLRYAAQNRCLQTTMKEHNRSPYQARYRCSRYEKHAPLVLFAGTLRRFSLLGLMLRPMRHSVLKVFSLEDRKLPTFDTMGCTCLLEKPSRWLHLPMLCPESSLLHDLPRNASGVYTML